MLCDDLEDWGGREVQEGGDTLSHVDVAQTVVPKSCPTPCDSMERSTLDTRGDRHSSRVEAKNPALLSNRDGYLLELTGWTQGSQAS